MFVIQKHGATITSAVAQMEDLLPELPVGPYKQQFEYTTTGPCGPREMSKEQHANVVQKISDKIGQ